LHTVHDLREVKKAHLSGHLRCLVPRSFCPYGCRRIRQCCSKIKDLVISGGENSSRLEIEEFLLDRKNFDGRQIFEGYFHDGDERSEKIPKVWEDMKTLLDLSHAESG